MCTLSRHTARAIVGATVCASLLCLLLSSCATPAVEGPTRGEEVVFFPSPAVASSYGRCLLSIQGRVFERAESSWAREALIDLLAPLVGAGRTDPIFRARARYFISDSESDTRVSVKLGNRAIRLPASDAAGYFAGDITLSSDEAERLAKDGMISFHSVPTDTNPEHYSGSVSIVTEEGITVITDMDDTMKITDMLDHDEKVANTFLRPFRAVPGMPALYRSWKVELGPSIHFHVVSAGPWQFYEPLRRFTEDAGFPTFTWDMRSIDIGDIWVLIHEISPSSNDTYQFKLGKIRSFMARFPKRHVVLVGDSGEVDPEVYAKVLSEFPSRVDAVCIREVRREDQNDRYHQLYRSREAAAKLRVFRDPKELPPLAPSPLASSARATDGADEVATTAHGKGNELDRSDGLDRDNLDVSAVLPPGR